VKSKAYRKSDALDSPSRGGHIRAPESDGFAGRLAQLVADEPQTAFAKRCGFSESTLRNYLDGADPSRARLLAIAEAANVSIEWLAAGRGPKERQGAPARFDDIERLTRTIAAVQEGLEATGRTLPPAKYAELVAAAYELMASPSASSARVIQFIKAAA
jgi:transcriptional regulator with XRE-family HTH domain